MDVVFCAATKDCLILKKTIKYVCRNLLPSHIYVITKLSNRYLFSIHFRKKYNVVLIDEDKLCQGLCFGNLKNYLANKGFTNLSVGWYFQQFLKMGFALSEYAKEDYLVWDSDTIPLRSLSYRTKEDNKPIFTIKTEYHKPYFDTIQNLLGMSKVCNGSFIAEHMLIVTSVMKSLIGEIQKEKKPWFEVIIDSINPQEKYAFSEFETYGTFVFSNYPNMYATQHLSTHREAGKFYGRCVTDKELSFLAKEYDTASFEAYHLPPKPRYYLCKLQSKFLEYYSLIFK